LGYISRKKRCFHDSPKALKEGSQFTSAEFLAPLQKRGIAISMDGRGRALDNVFIERLWRSLKYELIYPGDFASGIDLFPALQSYFHFTAISVLIQALGYQTPATYSHTDQKSKGSTYYEGSALYPGFNAVSARMGAFSFTAATLAVHSKCLLGGQGSARTRPEHRCKSGMDGGFTAAVFA
jgi:putative transposase